jgi:hypothetical protein
MEATSKTKTISIIVCVSVEVQQLFDVPVEYEIKGSTPKEAYECLIAEFGDQNVDAVEDPYELDLMDVMSINFSYIGDEFCQHNVHTNELNIKRFKSKKRR